MKTKTGLFIGEIEDFTATAFTGGGEQVEVSPTGLYASWDWNTVYIHYTGDDAQKAHILMELPKDPETLEKIGKGFIALAKTLSKGR